MTAPTADELNTLRHLTIEANSKTQFLQRTLTEDYVYLPDDMLVQSPDSSLFFRGDTRPPSVIFNEGFEPCGAFTSPIWRTDECDIHPWSAACVTRFLNVAICFPVKTHGEPAPATTWIYLIALNSYFDTHTAQADIAYTRLGTPGRNPASARNLLWGHEIAAMTIPGDRVVGAFQVTREWRGPDFRGGGTASIHPMLQVNMRAPSSYRVDVQQYFKARTTRGRMIKMATPMSLIELRRASYDVPPWISGAGSEPDLELEGLFG